jgi:hypothetical protein
MAFVILKLEVSGLCILGLPFKFAEPITAFVLGYGVDYTFVWIVYSFTVFGRQFAARFG